MKIFVDAGHNHSGGDTGASGFGLREQDISFYIAENLAGLLRQAGHEVKMSRNALEDNVGNTVSESINGRANSANNWGADLFFSIHCNAGGGTGTETLVYQHGNSAAETARKICDTVCARLDLKNRGVKERPDLGVLRLTTMPAVLVETAFIDNESDAWKLKNKQELFAQAIFEGICGKGESDVPLTVMKLPGEVYIQEIPPIDFEIMPCDCGKRDISLPNYFNCGYFAGEKGGKTIAVGNLANNGEVLAQAKDNPDWINVAGHKLTTIYTTNDGTCGLAKTDDLTTVSGLKTAVSGIPVIVGGKYVSLEEIKSEGYFGNELYNTWHGFLGVRHGKLVYVAMKCGFDEMCWALVALGIYDAVKLDGGGSFILKNGKELEGTAENRRINNVGVWKG